ncbi:hypothetical protein FB45DRAFT_1122519 [Roridomyces roridus]|uniref:Uncharacterized protein n=1 Tax=Roridomyces roridus TaxID=1738132 RepID=A0AAD7B4M6_9AGAR|nr:hypothetical protein FB45DRAFT_1122519 [Roridomyces roridus]
MAAHFISMFHLLPRIPLTQTVGFWRHERSAIVRFSVAARRLPRIYQQVDRHNIRYRPKPGTIVPTGWSCDWKTWEYNNLDEYQNDVQYNFGITSFIEPLAHEVRSARFVFYAGGDYYFHFPADSELFTLKRFTGTFKLRDDFVQCFKAELEAGAWMEVPALPDPPGLLTSEEVRAHPELMHGGLGHERWSALVTEIINKRER